MKLITENDVNSYIVEEIIDEATGKKDLYISGVFMTEEKKNRNGRVYPSAVMEKAVNKYIRDYVDTGRALGELNHPPTTQVNPERVSHLITELKKVGDNWMGKAKILDTPMGKIVRGIVEGGGSLGVSSRGVGSLKESNGVKIVQDDFNLCCVDVVSDPSAHDAWVGGIYESVDYEWKEGSLVEMKEVKEVKDEIVIEKDNTKSQIDAFESFMDKLKNF